MPECCEKCKGPIESYFIVQEMDIEEEGFNTYKDAKRYFDEQVKNKPDSSWRVYELMTCEKCGWDDMEGLDFYDPPNEEVE